jgi:hypothetical protein
MWCSVASPAAQPVAGRNGSGLGSFGRHEALAIARPVWSPEPEQRTDVATADASGDQCTNRRVSNAPVLGDVGDHPMGRFDHARQLRSRKSHLMSKVSG